ncbi:MAG: TIGR00282 family metallophosphoesterase [Oscillospiraceae bacterium]|nr:TIGR00282 family metallophosphoesterase [Oscillospiraceae bacterium]
MKILAVGDIVSSQGCDFLLSNLSKIKRHYGVDLTIVNGENSAVGNGVLPSSAETIFTAGADVITLGNHAFKRYEIYDYLDEKSDFIVRPANFGDSAPGKSVCYVDLGSIKVAVANVMGHTYMDTPKSPFDVIDELLEGIDAKIIIVDIHAEATSEKIAFAHYIDGKVSAVFGTHTHVQTADEQILPNGTGYITDVGMTGPKQSALGVDVNCVISKFKTNLPTRFEISDNPCFLNAVLFEIDEKTGKTLSVERIIVE